MSQSSESTSLPTPFERALAIVGAVEPVRLAHVLVDFASVVGSQFWDGRRTGPDFVVPTTSLTKRQSGHLARLVLRHGKSLPTPKLDVTTDAPHQNGDLQAVAVLDLNVPPDHVESKYSTRADVDLMVLVPILLSLLVILRTRRWSPALEFIAIDVVAALILGPGTLTLIRRTAVHNAELDPDFGCAVLMEDGFKVVIRGSQRIVEAVTEGGFYLSFADPRRARALPSVVEDSQEKQVVSDVLYGALEGGCRGMCEAIVMRFLHLHTAIPYLEGMAYVVCGLMMSKACWWGWKASTSDSVPPLSGITPLRSVARLTGEFLGLLMVAACVSAASSTAILLHGASFFIQSSYFALFARLVLQSQNYRVRTEQLLDALGRPSMRKWSFRTPASAATFVCLILCRDIRRPVRSINVLGLLDVLIPDDREVWRAWKERVADRVVHEETITFAPTIPTFRDMAHQKHLKYLLDEAQFAHDEYRSLSF